jgi:hypothetical protein
VRTEDGTFKKYSRKTYADLDRVKLAAFDYGQGETEGGMRNVRNMEDQIQQLEIKICSTSSNIQVEGNA